MTKYGPESKDLWIQARIDELMDDEIWHLINYEYYGDELKALAVKEATLEHAEIEAMILNAQIDNLELK